MIRLIRSYPLAGLLLALSLEAWIAMPGEALIALAAAALIGQGWRLARVAGAGLAGMLVNDLGLFGVSRLGRGLLLRWVGPRLLHLHLSAWTLALAQFLPPLRSAAFLLYGFQGTSLRQYFLVSLVSSTLWIVAYALLGQRFRAGISRALQLADGRGPWRHCVTALEIGVTVCGVALLLQPFC